ncbi:DUF1697 domain-containing protein [Sphingosinicella sp. BN140058]|uniref:DUF1697 domain-containing protein n=1 Tax=Sphingosinicella sp. BN140058 TaxID=1892855 RepID=UPI001010AE0E|nr:DUF1697 domain-containing protein [Sphingosinicella sp. BN140058]QAY77348.1 DUF1697 domain-containing protein [Sphingosinicella sp. BN140058]
MARFIALLRGINVGGHRKLPMADLRSLAEGLGLAGVRTYVASGNLVFSADGQDAGTLEVRLEGAIAERFGFAVDVIVREADHWARLAAGNPFPEQSAATPNYVMMTIGKRPATDADVEALRPRAAADERVERVGEALWFWFGAGSGRSKLAAAPLRDVWTARNWRTVQTIGTLLEAQ